MLKVKSQALALKLLAITPIIAALTGCGQPEVSLKGQEDKLAERQVTQFAGAIVYPDDNPSIPDGKLYYEKMQCAQCHGAAGEGVDGKGVLNDVPAMAKVKPIDQYLVLKYGEKDGQKTNHPALQDSISNRHIWDLVFYSRSFSTPPLSKEEVDKIQQVFGGNCAICHGGRGFGDGPLARNMDPIPANFHQFNRFYDRTDDTLYDHIANGIKWEGMPNFLGKQDRAKNVTFDEAYIHKLVMYVRNLHSSDKATIEKADIASTTNPSTTQSHDTTKQ